MGSIRQIDGNLVVKMTIPEIAEQPAWLKVPENQPPGIFKVKDYVINVISRAAWRIVAEKAKQLLEGKNYNAVKIAGSEITITFYEEKKDEQT